MSRIPDILKKRETEILTNWIKEMSSTTRRGDLMRDDDLKKQCKLLLDAVTSASQNGKMSNTEGAEWAGSRELLRDIATTRTQQGFSPSQIAMFVFSLKKPLVNAMREELGKDPVAFAEETWTANEMLDQLGLFTTEVFQKAREEVISRQQQDMLELSTPVVKLWDRILALPLIGTLDSARTQ